MNIKEEFGRIPCSVMRFSKDKELLKLIKDNSNLRKNEKSTGMIKEKKFSVFNPSIVKFLIKYYIDEDLTILDPFMGRGSRSVISSLLKRKYIGIDTCKKTVELNKFLNKDFKNSNKYIYGDGTNPDNILNIEDNIDCVLTCPPYYNKEKYSGEKGDLSYLDIQEYDKKINTLFETLYKLIPKSNFKKKKFYPIIFVVGTLRNTSKGILDMDRIYQNIALNNNFILHDKIIIEDTNLTKLSRFTHKRNLNCKYVCKNYETILIFIKY